MKDKYSAKSGSNSKSSPSRINLILALTVILAGSLVRCDCGIIKLLNNAEQFSGNPRTVTGKFIAPFDKQLTLYGWARLAPGMAIKNYVLFTLVNLKNQTSTVTKAASDSHPNARMLQSGNVSASVYEELIKVSWQGGQDNFLLQYPNGPTLSTSEVILVQKAFQSSTSWRFWAITLDYAEERGQFFFKDFETLDEKDHQIASVKFTDFRLNEDFRVVLGGDPKNLDLAFTGFMADIGLMTTYYESLRYISLINPIERSFASRGNLFTTDFSQLKNSKISFRAWGRSSNSSQSINAALLEKLGELVNEKEAVSKFNSSGIRVSSGDSVTVSDVDFSSDESTVINKLFVTFDFSFRGEFPVDFNIISYGDTRAANSFRISLVEENSETALKVFSKDRVNLLPLNYELSDYVYNSTLKNPRVIKVELVTFDQNVLTFLGKEILSEGQQHRITIGIIRHKPNIVRIYYSNANKQFSLTEEHSNLPFTLEKANLRLFADNNSVTGGSFDINSLSVTDSFFDFYQTNVFPEVFRNACYKSVGAYFFLLSDSSRPIQSGLASGSNQIDVIAGSSGFSGYAFKCDEADGFVKYQGYCHHSCPNGSFYLSQFNICKSCRQVLCDDEVLPIDLTVSVAQDSDTSDRFMNIQSRSSSSVYKIPQSQFDHGAGQSPFTSANLLTLTDVPVTVTSDSLSKDIDYKVKVNKSGFASGVYESDVQIEFLNPEKSSVFNIDPIMPSPPQGFQYVKSDKDKAYFSRKGIELDTSNIMSCFSVGSTGRILGIVFLVLFFLLVALFVITNCLFIDNYIKWRLLMTTIGAHLIALVVLVNSHLGKLSFGFTEIIYKILIR